MHNRTSVKRIQTDVSNRLNEVLYTLRLTCLSDCRDFIQFIQEMSAMPAFIRNRLPRWIWENVTILNWFHLLSPFQSMLTKGGEAAWRMWFSRLDAIETWIVYARENGQEKKDSSAFDQGVVAGVALQVRQELQCCWLLQTWQRLMIFWNSPAPKQQPACWMRFLCQYGPACPRNALHTMLSPYPGELGLLWGWKGLKKDQFPV